MNIEQQWVVAARLPCNVALSPLTPPRFIPFTTFTRLSSARQK